MTIFLVDDLPPESIAMLQALYSRSPASVLTHMKKVAAVGPEKFMSQYYVGYGHASIGDCGTTTIFVEGVSMLAAKAIQDWPLYSGQEASTRYMDFSDARVGNPAGSPVGEQIQANWMAFYNAAQQPMLDHLHAQFPRRPDEKEDVYERAINARKFDVLRAFLPAGTPTNLSWHTNLRQAADHLAQLCRHPDRTIRDLSWDIYRGLQERYPSSFGSTESVEAQSWGHTIASEFTYAVDVRPSLTVHLDACRVDHSELVRYRGLLCQRPARGAFPRVFDSHGQVTTRFLLDFGSFRDLQRHRNGFVRMPLLTTEHGFHPWYFDQMPVELAGRARELVSDQARLIRGNLGHVDPEIQQHYCAMGFRVACQATQTIPAFVYRIELRTNPSVHPTLRMVAQEEARLFQEHVPTVRIYPDMTLDTWDTRRGKQTILERES